MRPLTLMLLVTTALPLCRPTPALAAAPGDDRRVQEVEQQRQEQERIRLERAARVLAAEQAAQEEQRRLEIYKDESVAATRRRVGRLALAMSATTGCLTALSLYLDNKGVEAGRRSFRPISEGLGGFTVVTGLLGAGFLLSGLVSKNHDVAVDVAPGRMLASLGWRFH
jgi:hypothetical protein